jgi:O-antigen/teichoic acid export membrane protein
MEQQEPIDIDHTKPRKSIVVNMLFGFLSWILPGILVFFSTPIIVKALGTKEYGIYALIFGFISYSLSFTIGKAVTKYVAEYKPSDDHKKINDVISATFFLSILIGVAAALILSGAAGWLVRHVFEIDISAQEKSIESFYLAASVLLVYMLWQVFSSVVTGLHRFDVYSYITTLYGVFLAGGNIALALMGYGLVALFWWSLATNVFICVVSYFFARALYPEMRLSLWFHRETLLLVVKFSSGVILAQVFANILLLFERGIITRYLGPENLTYYVIPMTLAIYIQSFVGSFMIVVFPIASELGHQKEKQIVLYERTMKFAVTMVAFIAVTMITASRLFLTNWVGDVIADNSTPIMVIQVLIFSLMTVGAISWQLAEGLGHPNYNALQSFVWMAIGGVLMIVFIFWWGNFGVALGRLAGVLAIPLSILYVEHWLLGKTLWGFWVKLLSVVFAAALIAGAIEWFLFYALPGSWLTLMAGGTAGLLAFGGMLFLLGWYTPYEKQLLTRFRPRAREA